MAKRLSIIPMERIERGILVSNLKSQIVISSWGGARRGTPYAFTEQGVAMHAARVNIQIMRAFVRQIGTTNNSWP